MSSDAISGDVRRFIVSSIDSIAQLEALLICRNHPDMDWSVPDMAARLYITPEQTAAVLGRLAADGFVIVTNGDSRYRYLPSSAELAHIVNRLAEEYARHLIAITKLVHSKQGMRVQEFANAFKFRKESP